MIFNDAKLDNAVDKHRITQLSFLTAHGANYYKQKLIEQEFYDLTNYFVENSPPYIDLNHLKAIMSAHNVIIDLNKIYDNWVIKKNKPYNQTTMGYYNIVKEMIEETPNKLIGIAHKRKIHDTVKYKIEILDNTLLCDFSDLYIYPLYHEYKLYTADMVTFNKFTSEVAETGETPDKYNVCMVQYLKLGGNATERIFY